MSFYTRSRLVMSTLMYIHAHEASLICLHEQWCNEAISTTEPTACTLCIVLTYDITHWWFHITLRVCTVGTLLSYTWLDNIIIIKLYKEVTSVFDLCNNNTYNTSYNPIRHLSSIYTADKHTYMYVHT